MNFSKQYFCTLFFILFLMSSSLHAQLDAVNLDLTFNYPATSGGTNFWFALQPDGKILFQRGVVNEGIKRMNADGSVDNTFLSNIINTNVHAAFVLPNGKIMIGGALNKYNNLSAPGIARLNSDGSLDNTFNTGGTGITGSSAQIKGMLLLPDGKILIGGDFTAYNGVARKNIARINRDGSLDYTFNPGTGANFFVSLFRLLPSGKYLVAGDFTAYNGFTKRNIIRINPDGSFDNTFDTGTGPSYDVNSIAVQPDHKIIIGGTYTSVNGVSRNRIARLNENGSLDTSFDPGTGASSNVYAVDLLPNGKILVCGSFTTFNGANKKYIVRLYPDGSVDNTFNVGTGPDDAIYCSVKQPDGKFILGGNLKKYNNVRAFFVCRIFGTFFYNSITGNIFSDANKNCVQESTEKLLYPVIVKATPGNFYGSSNDKGKYEIVVDTGTASYTVAQQLSPLYNQLLVNQCTPSYTVNTSGAFKIYPDNNFADSVKYCALLSINVQNTRMARCFKGNTFVNYCNYGNSSADGAQIKIEYPPYIHPLSSVPAWSSKVGNTLIYDVGTLAASQCEKIILLDSVQCGDVKILGLTQCIKATISPASQCISALPGWDQSDILVKGSCENDVASFTITNSPTAADMSSSRAYRVYVNDTLVYNDTYFLQHGEQLLVTYPSEGQTLRLEADQDPMHPGNSRPKAIVEYCGISPSNFYPKGLVKTTPQDDLDQEVASYCGVIIGSYDPNSKEANPVGTGTTHQIAPGQELEYTIHFQNTGTGPAYTVKVVDTLDVSLDISSFQENGSSHAYQLSISGKGQAVLTYTFSNIDLPDSTSNLNGSKGLFSFRIKVPENTPLGSVIKNKSYIFFDYNDPIITNETTHTIGIDVPEDLSKGINITTSMIITSTSNANDLSLKIYPNPTSGRLTIENPNTLPLEEIRIYNSMGVQCKKTTLTHSSKQQLSIEELSTGIYIYELWQDGKRSARGLLQKL